jgi:hypothetical protein
LHTFMVVVGIGSNSSFGDEGVIGISVSDESLGVVFELSDVEDEITLVSVTGNDDVKGVSVDDGNFFVCVKGNDDVKMVSVDNISVYVFFELS